MTDYIFNPFVQAAGIFVATLVFDWVFRNIVKHRIVLAAQTLRSDPTNFKFLSHAVRALLIIFGAGMAINRIPTLHTLATSILASAGFIAVAVGFASQQALSNLVSGVFIIIFKPFRVNDRLELRGTFKGVVEDITLRHTMLRDYDNRRIIVPNSAMNTEILINADQELEASRILEIITGPDAPIDRVKTILAQVVEAHPDSIDKQGQRAKAAQVKVRVARVLSDQLTYHVRIYASDQSKLFELYHDLLEEATKQLDLAQIPRPLFKNG